MSDLKREPFQFSLRELLVLVTGASVVFTAIWIYPYTTFSTIVVLAGMVMLIAGGTVAVIILLMRCLARIDGWLARRRRD